MAVIKTDEGFLPKGYHIWESFAGQSYALVFGEENNYKIIASFDHLPTREDIDETLLDWNTIAR